MRARLILALLVTALAAPPAYAGSGGTTLPIAQAPYVAWLGGRCTGTLISPTRILTAAHCLDGQDLSDAQVLVGVDGNTLTGSARGLAVPVARVLPAPEVQGELPVRAHEPAERDRRR